MEERKCKICNTILTRQEKYCSRKCQWKSLEKPKKEIFCLVCGKLLIKKQTKYCSDVCKGSDPAYKKLQSDTKKQLYKDHPELFIEIGKTISKIYVDHPEKRIAASNLQKDKYKDPAYVESHQIGHQKRWSKQEEHDNASSAQLKYNQEHPEKAKIVGEKISQNFIDHPEKRIESSNTTKEKWQDLEYREKHEKHWNDPKYFKKLFARRKTTKPERIFIEIIEKNSFPFYFNGCSQGKDHLVIKRKVPDFVHNTDKMLIEIYGNKWHANPLIYKTNDIVHHGKSAQQIWDCDSKRLKILQEAGYSVLIIWESEFAKKNISNVIDKVNNFILSEVKSNA